MSLFEQTRWGRTPIFTAGVGTFFFSVAHFGPPVAQNNRLFCPSSSFFFFFLGGGGGGVEGAIKLIVGRREGG